MGNLRWDRRKSRIEVVAHSQHRSWGLWSRLCVPLRTPASSAVRTLPGKMNINEVSGAIIDAAMKAHSALGPELLESAYQACLKHELRKRGLKVLSELGLPVVYDDLKMDVGYRLDLLVEDLVIVEAKAVDALAPIHEAQLLCYLKLSEKKVGLLINFNVLHLRDGIRRMVNRL